MKHQAYVSEDPMPETLNDAIRIRAGKELKDRAERLAKLLSKQQPPGARKITIADVTRMALEQFVAKAK